jgi:hypothetical protein
VKWWYIVQSIGGRIDLGRINECERKNTSKLNEVNDRYVIWMPDNILAKIRVTMKSRGGWVLDEVSPYGKSPKILITAQLVKFSAFYGIQTFIITFTKVDSVLNEINYAEPRHTIFL